MESSKDSKSACGFKWEKKLTEGKQVVFLLLLVCYETLITVREGRVI